MRRPEILNAFDAQRHGTGLLRSQRHGGHNLRLIQRAAGYRLAGHNQSARLCNLRIQFFKQ
ncbi:hypothetical protein D3C73_1633270 [compost metagenome]